MGMLFVTDCFSDQEEGEAVAGSARRAQAEVSR